MFENVIENYKKMKTSDKREKLISEMKLLIAVFEKMCIDNGIEYRKVKSKEVLDLNNGMESEDDYLEAAFVYVEYLKEVLGSLFIKLK